MSRPFWFTAALAGAFVALALAYGAPVVWAVGAGAYAIAVIGTVDIQRRRTR